jgi:hypothetical protein
MGGVSLDELLEGAAENHREWFRRRAMASDGRLERVGGIDLVLAEAAGTIGDGLHLSQATALTYLT